MNKYKPFDTDNMLMCKEVKGPETSIISECVLIDSRSRNLSTYPKSSRFRVKFGPSSSETSADSFITKKFKNVQSIKISDVVIPSNLAGTEQYISLLIPELQDTFHGTTEITRRAFAILIPDFSTTGGTFTNFRVKTSSCHCFKVFDPPIAFTSLTFELYSASGELLNAPSEVSIDPDNQIVYSLQIQSEIPLTPFRSHFT